MPTSPSPTSRSGLTARLRRHAERARARRVPHRVYTEAEVWERGGGRCYLCGQPLTPDAWQIEHVIPMSRGGPNTITNVMPAHRDCNLAKGARVTHLPEGPLRRALQQTVVVFARLYRAGFPTVPLAPTIAPHVSTLRLATVPGHAHAPASIAAEIRAAVHSPRARVYVHGAELRVEMPRTQRRPVALRSMPRWGIGLDTQNRPVNINLAASPGVLIAGQTGSGKSTVVQDLIYHCALSGGRLIVVDPKFRAGGAALKPFRRLAALECAVANAQGASDALALALSLMNAREPGGRHPMLAVVVDEIQELTVAERAIVERLAKLGREVNVQVIVTTQHPTRDVVTNALKNQLTWWIAGRVQNASASTLVIGHSGAQHLGDHGDMIVANGGREVRIQAALGGPDDWARLAQKRAEPEPAPAAEVASRNVRKPDDEAVSWAVDRAVREGFAPSATSIQRRFGGSTDAARRRRDAALEVLTTA